MPETKHKTAAGKTKLFISPYRLQLKNKRRAGLNPEGALLAFDFGSGLRGFSDFLPWPCFGEKPLFAQLRDAQKGMESLRLRLARQSALRDALARSENRSLFFGLKFPRSHFLIEDILPFRDEEKIPLFGYDYVKLKLRPAHIPKQLKKLKALARALPSVKWRLDLGGAPWRLWRRRLDFMEGRLDFIEDPGAAPSSGQDSRIFAEDWLPGPARSIKIAKPSRDSLKSLEKGLAASRWRRIIFTHSLEHPLGQAAAACQAARFYQNHGAFFETGALKCLMFNEGDFCLNQNPDPVFRPPKGPGFGFGGILTRQNWRRWL